MLSLDAEDHRRLRRLLPVRPRPARQRDGPAHRPVPHRQPALRRRVRADEQGAAGLLPRRGRRPGQLHPGTPGRHGRPGDGIDRVELRRRNFIQPDQFPYKIPTGNIYDSGDYEAVLDRALEIAGLDQWRTEQERLRAEGRYLGIGLATCQERSGYNASSGGSSTATRRRCPRPAPRRAARSTSTPWAASARARLPAVGQQPRDRRRARSSPRSSASTRPASRSPTPTRQPARCRRGPAAAAHDHALGRGPRRGAHDQGQDDPHRGARDGDEPRRRRVRRRHVPREGGAGHVDDDGRGRDARPPVRARQPGGPSPAGWWTPTPTTTRTRRRRTPTARTWAPSTRWCRTPATSRSSRSTRRRAGHAAQVLRVNDCGTIMNPPLVEGQIMGGIVQGIGAALMEQYEYRDRRHAGHAVAAGVPDPDPERGARHRGRARADALAVHRVRREGRGGGRPARRADRDRQRRERRPAPAGVFIDELPMTPERIVTAVQAAR